MPERPPPEECANCGAAIPRSARACPECGADERTGWRETDLYDGLNLPDEAYSDDGRATERPTAKRGFNGVAWYWWCVGVVLLILLVTGIIVLRW